MPHKFGSVKKRDMFDLDTIEEFDPFKTTSKVFFSPTTDALSTSKFNFKKKTPFTQFVNASFAGGVFFNSPVAGI